MKRRTTERAAEEREYNKQAKAFLEEWPHCQNTQGCGNPSEEVHHMAGRRGWRLLYQPWWIALCHDCHSWATVNPAAAEEAGVSLSRYSVPA